MIFLFELIVERRCDYARNNYGQSFEVTMDKPTKVSSLAEKNNNAFSADRILFIEELLEEAKDEKSITAGGKYIFIALDDRENESYNISVKNCGISMAEALSIMRCAEQIILQEMGY